MNSRKLLLFFLYYSLVLLTLLSSCDTPSPAFHSDWTEQTDRVWVGPQYWANRLQDWQVSEGRLACVENSELRPMRVVHLLTGALRNPGTDLRMQVTTGPIDAGALDAESWTGFLIGAGDEQIDYRLTALTHHRAAEDGGMFVGVDGTGRVVFRDFSQGGGGDTWSVTGKTKPGELAETEASQRSGAGLEGKSFSSLKLELTAQPAAKGFTLSLSVTDTQNGAVVSSATLTPVSQEMLNGSMALVSHRGPAGSDKGFWFQDWQVTGSRFIAHPERSYGPILAAQHTLSKGTLKLTAQLTPLGPKDPRELQLQIRKGGAWETVATTDWIDDSYTAAFRVDNWDSQADTDYRVRYAGADASGKTQEYVWEGTIRHDPTEKEELVVAAFTGHKIFTGGLKWNHNGVWFPHNELVAATAYHQPDLLFFSGDQVYEGDLTGAQYAPEDKAILDYLDKWYRWCWAFGDLARDIPTLCIPDDHDVYHGNIWGAGGKQAPAKPENGIFPDHYKGRESHWQQDQGGYKMSSRFVNMVQRTQTSHFPDPYDATPVQQEIGVYYTDLLLGGVSFAVIEDRKWKSSPSLSLPDANVVNGFIQHPRYDKTKTDNPEAVLLGDRQLDFLEAWGQDWKDSWMKVVLSQTIFANLSTYPDSFETDAGTPSLKPYPVGVIPEGYSKAIDMDSNGWPQTGRNQAVRTLRKAYAFHIAGDQHLGSTIQYGVDEWRDAGYAVCVPSIGNTWPRRWYPKAPGLNPIAGQPAYTGDYTDGFGNRMSVHAVSNPIISNHEPKGLHDRAPGYGIIRLNRNSRDITIEVWPRWEDPAQAGAAQYPGWPIRINQFDNFAASSPWRLPTLKVSGMTDPVVQISDAASGEIVCTVRIRGTEFVPKVLKAGTYTLRVGEPGTEQWRELAGWKATKDAAGPAREVAF